MANFIGTATSSEFEHYALKVYGRKSKFDIPFFISSKKGEFFVSTEEYMKRLCPEIVMNATGRWDCGLDISSEDLKIAFDLISRDINLTSVGSINLPLKSWANCCTLFHKLKLDVLVAIVVIKLSKHIKGIMNQKLEVIDLITRDFLSIILTSKHLIASEFNIACFVKDCIQMTKRMSIVIPRCIRKILLEENDKARLLNIFPKCPSYCVDNGVNGFRSVQEEVELFKGENSATPCPVEYNFSFFSECLVGITSLELSNFVVSDSVTLRDVCVEIFKIHSSGFSTVSYTKISSLNLGSDGTVCIDLEAPAVVEAQWAEAASLSNCYFIQLTYSPSEALKMKSITYPQDVQTVSFRGMCGFDPFSFHFFLEGQNHFPIGGFKYVSYVENPEN